MACDLLWSFSSDVADAAADAALYLTPTSDAIRPRLLLLLLVSIRTEFSDDGNNTNGIFFRSTGLSLAMKTFAPPCVCNSSSEAPKRNRGRLCHL